MWYLTWMLGTALACGVAVAVGLWYELHQERLDGNSADASTKRKARWCE